MTESVKESFSATEEEEISIEIAFSLAEKGGLLLAVIFEIEGFSERRGGSRRKEAEKGGQISESLEEPERGEIFWLRRAKQRRKRGISREFSYLFL